MKKLLIITVIVSSLAFTAKKIKTLVFTHHNDKDVSLSLKSKLITKTKRDERGGDCYFSNLEEKNPNFNFSILYYKLTEEEKLKYVDIMALSFGAPKNSPVYPYTYFSTTSKLKAFETNKTMWQDTTKGFMYRHAQINEVMGKKVNMKNMYAYTMFKESYFVQAHISKINPTKQDSIDMVEIISSLSK